jgi:hypothetical protein
VTFWLCAQFDQIRRLRVYIVIINSGFGRFFLEANLDLITGAFLGLALH